MNWYQYGIVMECNIVLFVVWPLPMQRCLSCVTVDLVVMWFS